MFTWANFFRIAIAKLKYQPNPLVSGYFKQDNIFLLDTPWGEQPFRISNPVKTDELLKSKAYHVCNDLKNYFILKIWLMCHPALIFKI